MEKKGGEVFVFSSAHSSGQKLDNLSGIACILRFPVFLDLDEEELEEDDTNVVS